MKRRHVFSSYVEQWAHTYFLRAKELFFWMAHKQVWRSGYGEDRLSKRAMALEFSVRLAELMGLGLIYTGIELLFAGKRYRVLTEVERAFAKTYFTDRELALVFVDEKAAALAKRMNIAYVLGYAIKTYGVTDLPLLMHELVHVRQFKRWGWAYVAKALSAQLIGSGYTYGRLLASKKVKDWCQANKAPQEFYENPLESQSGTRQDALLGGNSYLPSLNAEQEAARLEDDVRIRCGFRPRWVF